VQDGTDANPIHDQKAKDSQLEAYSSTHSEKEAVNT
jgi:hypothetical protein